MEMSTEEPATELKIALDAARDALAGAVAEIDRLQTILDSRPAINAALPDSYIAWSQSIYAAEARHAGVIPVNASKPN